MTIIPLHFLNLNIYVNVKPKTTQYQLDMMLTETISNISPAQQPKYYLPFAQAKFDIQRQSKSLNELKQYNQNLAIKKELEKNHQATTWLPLKANAVDMLVLINKEKGEVVKIVDLRPWK